MSDLPDGPGGAEPAFPAGFGPGDLVLLRAVETLRWIGLVPMVVVLWLRRDTLDRPVLAFGLLVVAVVYSAYTSLKLSHRDPVLFSPRIVLIGVGVAAALMAGDGWVLGWRETFDPPALGGVWVLSVVLLTGISYGSQWGGLAGVAIIAARLIGVAAPEVEHGPPSFDSLFQIDRPRLVPTISLMALYGVVGAGAGFISRLQRRAEQQISAAKAREEVARSLHDGVMQTLALVQRRSTDPELAQLAHETDLELRTFLTAHTAPPSSLEVALRTTCQTFAHRFGINPQLMIDDLPKIDQRTVVALAGAAAEALTNAGKHAEARHVTVYAGRPEPGSGIMVTVNDDGRGFDPAATPDNRGLARSVHDRISEVGGTVTIRSMSGAGTEVVLWAP